MSWSEEAYRSVTSILEDIKAHPFIRELALGTLSKDKFSRYIAQDKIYLKGYAAEMEAISQMLPPGPLQRCRHVQPRCQGIPAFDHISVVMKVLTAGPSFQINFSIRRQIVHMTLLFFYAL